MKKSFNRLERLRNECKADFSLLRRRASLAAEQAEACITFYRKFNL